MPGAVHETPAGAAVSGVEHALGGHENPAFREDRTVPQEETNRPTGNGQSGHGVGRGPQVLSTSNGVEVICGPLLNYRGMSKERTDNPVWRGSVLIVTTPGQVHPELKIRIRRPAGGDDDESIYTGSASFTKSVRGEKLYEDPKGAFWRFMIEVPFQARESTWEYGIGNAVGTDRNPSDPAQERTFAIPAKSQSMRLLFHSCNGFSAGTDESAWSGPALWNDVLRIHNEKPFHVMIGGGDQIYNDGVRVDGPLKAWTDIGNPKRRREFPFNEDLRSQCDQYYYDNYVRWYNTKPFSTANGQIPQLNIWDDHDIIDGFGSYTDHFMQCPVFRGIGGVAHKYYLLFQHHLAPPVSTYTTDAEQTTHANAQGTSGRDAVQLKDAWVNTEVATDPCYIIGKSPGPYVEERSRSIYCQLGARMAFLGIDARTERTRHQINYPETYKQIFSRVSHELAAANGSIKHLILLLGVPIAYPRLQWLENIFQSPVIGPLRFLNKRFGFAGGFFNHFDGQVDLLDDLDDHYTAHQHKKERKGLILQLQNLAREHSVRVTILGGDVHLAALGRFYSNPKQNIPATADWRFMTNVISSAITNKPPPTAVANLLARRNKIHHLDTETDETLLNLFDVDPAHDRGDVKNKTQDKNHCTMPSRNFAVITESRDHEARARMTNGDGVAVNGGDPTNGVNGHATNGVNGAANHTAPPTSTGKNFTPSSNPRSALHEGESNAGAAHPASSGLEHTGLGGPDGLDVTIRVEIDQHDPEGRTRGYGLSIPGLDCRGFRGQGKTW